MASFNNVPQGKLIDKTAQKLKNINEIKPPEWANIVKTGTQKQRPPVEDDWWYTRSAAVLRTLLIKGPIGVSKLRTKYGGRKRRGHKPPKFAKGSGSIQRKVLQQLESAGLAKKNEKSVHKGRMITTKGLRLLNDAAKELFKEYPKKSVQQAEEAKIEAEAKKASEKKLAQQKEKTEVKEEAEVKKVLEKKPAQQKEKAEVKEKTEVKKEKSTKE